MSRISTSYVDPVPPVNDTGASMVSGRRFETRMARPFAVDVSSLRRLTLAVGLLLSILLLNLRGLLRLDNFTAGRCKALSKLTVTEGAIIQRGDGRFAFRGG